MPVDAKIPAIDGFELAATIFAGTPEWLIINSDLAVPRSFYAPLAEYFCSQGLSVVTYDYRGTGDSRPQNLKGFSARARDWGMKDAAGLLKFVTSRTPRNIYMIGHGLGGLMAGLIETPRLDALATFSSYNWYWGNQPGDNKYLAGWKVVVAIPLSRMLLGYAHWTGVSGTRMQIPSGVAEELALWCRNEAFLMGDRSLPLGRYESFKAPILSHSVSDDPLATLDTVDSVMRAYSRVQRRHLEPPKFGLSRLGPSGYFRPDSKTLWPELLTWFRNPSPKRK